MKRKGARLIFLALVLWFVGGLAARSITVFSSALPGTEAEMPEGAFLFQVVGRLEEGEHLKSLRLRGPGIEQEIPAFVFGEEVCAQHPLSLNAPDFTEFSLIFLLDDGAFTTPLVCFGNVLFAGDAPALALDIEITGRHVVQAGEYLYRIAQLHQSSVAFLEILNQTSALIYPGQILRVGRVSVSGSPIVLSISLSDCQLTFFLEGTPLRTYPVAVGRGQSSRPGTYFITRKIPNPALYWEGEYIQPLAPINGLGTWWLELSNPQYGIHGTNRPWEIGKRVSHGCIRLFNEDIEQLQRLLPIGTIVKIY